MLRNAGLAHLLAISGLHIGLVAGIVFFGLRLALVMVPGLALRYPVKKWSAVGAIVAAFFYALLAGATLPTQRAFLMVSLILLAVLLDRRGISLRAVAWSAFVVLLFQPESLLSPSFQMSFAAAGALVAAFDSWRMWRRQRFRHGPSRSGGITFVVGHYLAGIIATTLIASLATAPFALYHFNQIADYGLLANLFAVPLTALWVMPWAVVSLVLMPFGWEGASLQAMGWGLVGIVRIAEWVSMLPGSVTRLAAMPDWGLISISVGACWLLIWRRKWRFLAIPVIAGGVLSVVFAKGADILIDGQANLFAFAGEAGELQFSTLTRGRSERDMWLRQVGATQASLIAPSRPGPPKHAYRCDAGGCLYEKAGQRIAVALSERVLIEDCWRAEAVISLVPVRRSCPADVVIDRFDLWRDGAHAISIHEGRVIVRSANGERGARPWVIRPGASRRPSG